MKAVTDKSNNIWKVIMIKTIDGVEPVYYRLVNLYTYDIVTIPAYRLLDEIINEKKNIINIKCTHNIPVIIDENGYISLDEVIIVDEFDAEIPDIFEWSLRNELGNKIMSRYSTEANTFSPSNYKIDSLEKLYWTCNNGHTINCGFPTYFSTKCKCPICDLEDKGETPSLKYWAYITNNFNILKEYDEANNNSEYSSDISWKSRKKVWFRRGDEEVQECLYNVTVKNMEPPFLKNKKQVINLNKHKKK